MARHDADAEALLVGVVLAAAAVAAPRAPQRDLPAVGVVVSLLLREQQRRDVGLGGERAHDPAVGAPGREGLVEGAGGQVDAAVVRAAGAGAAAAAAAAPGSGRPAVAGGVVAGAGVGVGAGAGVGLRLEGQGCGLARCVGGECDGGGGLGELLFAVECGTGFDVGEAELG